MSGKPGRSGKNRGINRPWQDAVSLAVNRIKEGDPDGRKCLAIIAEKVVNLAMEGDMAAVKEVAYRLDGPKPQPLKLTTPEDGLFGKNIRFIIKKYAEEDTDGGASSSD